MVTNGHQTFAIVLMYVAKYTSASSQFEINWIYNIMKYEYKLKTNKCTCAYECSHIIWL